MDQRYPIGRWEKPSSIEMGEVSQCVARLGQLPEHLEELLRGCNPSVLERSYREGGWSLRQVIHHLADSHMNAYIRHKLAVTVECPLINPYPEEKWARLPDVEGTDAAVSVRLIAALHVRWCTFLNGLPPEDFNRIFYHPGMGRVVRLGESVSLYDWHGRHHLAHIRMGLERK